MKNNSMEQYSEYRIHDTIGRLEAFRNQIGWGELNDDLALAIECLEYLLDSQKQAEAQSFDDVDKLTKPHWIVEDHGFAGTFFKCSKCGESYWGYAPSFDDEACTNCHTAMDPEDNEYVD